MRGRGSQPRPCGGRSPSRWDRPSPTPPRAASLPSRRRTAPWRGTSRAARRRPSHAPPSGAPTIQWAGVARERSLVLPVLLTAIVGLGALSIDMFLPSLPAMTLAFGSDAATAQLTVTLFLAGLAAGQLVWGPLSDRLRRRRVLLAGPAPYPPPGPAGGPPPRMSPPIAPPGVPGARAGGRPGVPPAGRAAPLQ